MPTTSKRRDQEHCRRLVGQLLLRGERTGADIRDELAARCGSKEAVGRAVQGAQKRGQVEPKRRAGDHVVWGLTDTGRVWAASLGAP